MTTFDECMEGFEQSLDVVEMKSCSRFVEDKKRLFLLLLTNEISQFYTLVLSVKN